MNPIDNYIKQFLKEVQEKLLEIRKIIFSAAPEAKEKISYGMPGFFSE